MKTSVEVEIFGSTYVIKSDSDPKYTRKLAKFVDQKMMEVGDSSKIVSTQKIAVLTLMNIADAFFKSKNNNQDRLLKEIEKKSESMLELISSVDGP